MYGSRSQDEIFPEINVIGDPQKGGNESTTRQGHNDGHTSDPGDTRDYDGAERPGSAGRTVPISWPRIDAE